MRRYHSKRGKSVAGRYRRNKKGRTPVTAIISLKRALRHGRRYRRR